MFLNKDIDSPVIDTYVPMDYWETPEEIQVELEKDTANKEADFRRWLIKNKPKGALLTPIETSTAVGVPDIFCCYNGFSSWIECKILSTGNPRFRGTQYSYLKKLIEAGGHAKIAVQRINTKDYKPSSIWVYDAEKLVSLPSGMFKTHGQDMVFPSEVQPYYIWYYKKTKIEDLYEKLLFDITDFTW